MTHLEFTNALDALGVSIQGNNIEGKEKTYYVPRGLGQQQVVVKNLSVEWAEKSVLDFQYDAKDALIARCIDLGEWKYSWHNDIAPQNYEKFREILQGMIMERAKQIEMLLTGYFILGKEISDRKEASHD